MPVMCCLRDEANAEAERLLALRAQDSVRLSQTARDLLITTIRGRNSRLCFASAIFFARSTIADASGRALEAILVPVALRLDSAVPHQRRCDVRSSIQRLMDVHGPAVVAAAHEHVGARMTPLTEAFGLGFERALKREQRLRQLIERKGDALIQAGLFDTRSLNKEDEEQRKLQVCAESDSRIKFLRFGSSALSIQRTTIVLILLCGGRS